MQENHLLLVKLSDVNDSLYILYICLSFNMLLNIVKYLIICVSIESFSGNLPCSASICLHTLSCSFSKESLKIGDASFKL